MIAREGRCPECGEIRILYPYKCNKCDPKNSEGRRVKKLKKGKRR